MARPLRRQWISLIATAALLAAAFGAPAAGAFPAGAAPAGAADPVPVDLHAAFDNPGIGSAPGKANVDGSGYGYPAANLPAAGRQVIAGIPFDFPAADTADDVVALGQTIPLTPGHYHEAYVLGAATYGATGGQATVHYSDGTTSTAQLSEPDWYSATGAAVSSPSRYTPTGTDPHPVGIFLTGISFDPAKSATSVTLPALGTATAGTSALHVFAMSLQPVVAGLAVRILNAGSTTKTFAGDSSRQIVDATIENVGSQWVVPGDPVRVSVNVGHAQTVTAASVTWLAPGEQTPVEIGIRKGRDVLSGTPANGTVVATVGGHTTRLATQLTLGIPAYTAASASLAQHQSPDWFDNAKFGIFIHWGVYSVPAWAPVGGTYAEWYWHSMNTPGDPTNVHHAQAYGKNFNYDQFIPKFTAAKFDPKSWVQLFQQAGAKYFVLTSKHHEGFSLFNTKYSDRNSVQMGPHQDLVGELFAADRKYAPSVHPGVYYSLPEWYNPAMPTGNSTFPGGSGLKNPYTGQPVPYTGYKPVNDYVNDFQVPQLEELINNYSPDVIWCDIGYPATSPQIAADYFNHAAAKGEQVTINDRCGLPNGDYSTPEYTTYPNTVVQKWEASRGMDPHSYGYNSQTPDSAYMTADQIVQTLVDITSKNGNFLLDIGPKADGTIPAIMQERLRETGAWLKVNGESVYGTTYWSRTAAEGDLRFTVAPNKAFYITSLSRPAGTVTVTSPVPIRAGQKITLLGYQGRALTWTKQNGNLVIDVPAAARNSGSHAWVFKITW